MSIEIIDSPLENFPDACVVSIYGSNIYFDDREGAERFIKHYQKTGHIRFHGDEKRLMEAE